jgi:hypothetical protein
MPHHGRPRRDQPKVIVGSSVPINRRGGRYNGTESFYGPSQGARVWVYAAVLRLLGGGIGI